MSRHVFGDNVSPIRNGVAHEPALGYVDVGQLTARLKERVSQYRQVLLVVVVPSLRAQEGRVGSVDEVKARVGHQVTLNLPQTAVEVPPVPHRSGQSSQHPSNNSV